jgi:hypothetical protein
MDSVQIEDFGNPSGVVLRQALEKLQNAPIGVTDVFADEP